MRCIGVYRSLEGGCEDRGGGGERWSDRYDTLLYSCTPCVSITVQPSNAFPQNMSTERLCPQWIACYYIIVQIDAEPSHPMRL